MQMGINSYGGKRGLFPSDLVGRQGRQGRHLFNDCNGLVADKPV
jgi:hypothetical protein